MARKESVTINQIREAAFALSMREGVSSVTARKVAAEAGCSTQPIFRVYRNMEDLCKDVYDMASDHFQGYYNSCAKASGVPFVNLGMAYIRYAQEFGNLFKLLFLSDLPCKRPLYEVLNGKNEHVLFEINLARVGGCKNPQAMFMRMWLFINGAACMSLTGDYDLSEEETRNMLEQEYERGK